MVILFLWVCSSTSQRQHPAEYPSRAANSSKLQTHRLPRIGNLFRTDFRFAPSPRSASLAGPPIHEGHGRPRSVRKSSRLRWKHHLPSCSCSPASNRPHSAEKSTPVWLAIWRTWAGFANSQLRCANFCSNYSYKCSSPLLPHWAAARTQQISRPICADCLRHLRISAG